MNTQTKIWHMMAHVRRVGFLKTKMNTRIILINNNGNILYLNEKQNKEIFQNT